MTCQGPLHAIRRSAIEASNTASVALNHVTNGTNILNLRGTLTGHSQTRALLNVGATGDATKNCRLSELGVALAGTVAQSIIVYGNDTPWKLSLTSAFCAGGAMQIAAANSNMNNLSFTVKSGVETATAASSLDFSGNALSATNVRSLLAAIVTVVPTGDPLPVCSLNVSGGTNSPITHPDAMANAILAAAAGWTVTANSYATLTVTSTDHPELNGVYTNTAGEYIRDANTKIAWDTDTWKISASSVVIATVDTDPTTNTLTTAGGWLGVSEAARIDMVAVGA